MSFMIFTTLVLLVGISLIVGCGYYLMREMNSRDSVRNYGSFIAVGMVITSGMIIKII